MFHMAKTGYRALLLALALLAQMASGQGRRAQTTAPEPQTPAGEPIHPIAATVHAAHTGCRLDRPPSRAVYQVIYTLS